MAYISPNVGDGIIGRLSCQLLEWLRHLAGILKRNIRRLFEGLHGGFGEWADFALKGEEQRARWPWMEGVERRSLATVCSGYAVGMQRVCSGRVH
jgi:hypothetical protein